MMKLSIRRVAAPVLSSVLGLLLASCASEESSDKEVIEIWQGFNAEETDMFREMMLDFEKQWEAENGKDLEIKIQYVSFNDMFTKLRTAALADITPDIAFVDSIKVTDLAFGNALVPVNELDAFKADFESIEGARSEFVNASFDAGIVNRLGETQLYGLPVQTTTVSLFWNREIFRNRADELRAAGLDPNRAPKTWKEMEAYGEVLTDAENGVYALGMHSSLWFNFPFFNMYQVPFIQYDDAGIAEAELDSENGVAALQRLVDIASSDYEGGAWKRSALSPEQGFLNRVYAMAMTGPWNVENFTNAGLDFDVSLIPAPTEDEIEALGLQPAEPELVEELGVAAWSSSNVGGQTGVILRSSEKPELAYELLAYFTGEENQRKWASSLGQIPVRLSAWEDLDMTKYPYIPKFMRQLRLARRIPQVPLYGILESDVFNPQIDLLLQNRQTPEQMVERMEAGMDEKILKKMNESTRLKMKSTSAE